MKDKTTHSFRELNNNLGNTKTFHKTLKFNKTLCHVTPCQTFMAFFSNVVFGPSWPPYFTVYSINGGRMVFSSLTAAGANGDGGRVWTDRPVSRR